MNKKGLCIPISLWDLGFEVYWNELFSIFILTVSLLWGKWKLIKTRLIHRSLPSGIQSLFLLHDSSHTCGRWEKSCAREVSSPVKRSWETNPSFISSVIKMTIVHLLLDAYTQFPVSYNYSLLPLWNSNYSQSSVWLELPHGRSVWRHLTMRCALSA